MRLSLLSFSLFALFACSTAIYAQNPEPDCPAISVTGPAGIAQPGDEIPYTLDIGESKKKYDLTYHWSVSVGEIISGQGTTMIKVKWSGDNRLTATVEIKGLPDGCMATASESAIWDAPPAPSLIDAFGRLSNNAVNGRLTKFFTELLNNPNSQGYIINYGTDKEVEAREKLILKTINFRDFGRSRITLVRGGRHESGKVFTKLYRVPPGADNPSP